MSFAEIEKRILAKAEQEAVKTSQETQVEIKKLAKLHAEEMQEVKAQILKEAKAKAEAEKRSILVPARLDARKALLEEKQNIIGKIYAEIKKEKKLSGPETTKLREQTEIKAAEILFGA